jgi:malonate decarboxylase beta subunit
MMTMNVQQLLQRESFIEIGARVRARHLLDAGSFRELIDPFERFVSPWLALQGIVTQADDGVVVAKGTIDGKPAVVLAIEGAFQGGSMGEVSAAKIAGALELCAEDNRNGVPTGAVIVFETGGVRLQEANLGLAGIAEIQAAIVDLRRYQPVIGIAAGTVGCYGGMSIAAGLCSYLIVTRETRIGLNGPAVIEQEAGVAEFDSRDKPLIWSLTGGEQRYRTGLADVFVDDDIAQIRSEVVSCFRAGRPVVCRSERARGFLTRLAEFDPGEQATSAEVARIYRKGFDA